MDPDDSSTPSKPPLEEANQVSSEPESLPHKETDSVTPAPDLTPDTVQSETPPEHIIDTPPTPVIEPQKPTEKPRESLGDNAPVIESKPQPAPEPKPAPTPAHPKLIPEPVKPPEFDVNTLTDEQLRQAAALYTKRNQAALSSKGVAKRKETMQLNLREIVDYLSHDNGAPLPRIAKHTNITLGTTSKYLRQLIASGKVRATGWGKTRRYYLK